MALNLTVWAALTSVVLNLTVWAALTSVLLEALASIGAALASPEAQALVILDPALAAQWSMVLAPDSVVAAMAIVVLALASKWAHTTLVPP